MVKVALIGVFVTFLSLLLSREKREYGIVIGIGAGLLIFSLLLSQVGTVVGFLEELTGRLSVGDGYLGILLKLLGITYVAEFASSICRDAGYSSLAGQIELFAKISILALSIPTVTYILELVEEFLA
jgi:stage III sporulation protein AD